MKETTLYNGFTQRNIIQSTLFYLKHEKEHIHESYDAPYIISQQRRTKFISLINNN